MQTYYKASNHKKKKVKKKVRRLTHTTTMAATSDAKAKGDASDALGDCLLHQPTPCTLKLEQMRRDIQRIMMYNKLKSKARPICQAYNALVEQKNNTPQREGAIDALQLKVNTLLEEWLKETITRFRSSVQHHCL